MWGLNRAFTVCRLACTNCTHQSHRSPSYVCCFCLHSLYAVKFHRIPMSFLLVNLAVADIIYAAFITPRVFYQLPFAHHPDGVFGTVLCKFVSGGSVAWTGSACSIVTFVAIAIERYYAVMYPHKWNLTKRKLQVS